KLIKIPIAIGGGFAAVGTFILYKTEQLSNYTKDQFTHLNNHIITFKDFSLNYLNHLNNNMKQNINESLDSFNSYLSSHNLEDNNSGDNNSGNNNSNNNDNNKKNSPAIATAAAASISLIVDNENNDNKSDFIKDHYDDDNDTGNDNDNDNDISKDRTDQQILSITRRMIEIRNLLNKIDKSDSLKLPSIVVIGSQSSGKSSVLESIVGREFLPKGSNMVTRRPIELTLINDPTLNNEIAEFPDLKIDKLSDFNEVSRLLFELNLAVPSNKAITDDPIRLTIKSPTIPDLTLVDLPGYIQIQSIDQPVELKTKIRDLCSKYLKQPNIILAISSADVDLANSSALQAAKSIDPNGERTIGVITKMDLVDPFSARGLLLNKKYPLKLGYVGVITKIPKTNSTPTSLFLKKKSSSELFNDLQKNEFDFFNIQNKSTFQNLNVGTKNLKKKLMKILESSMSNSLNPTHDAVQQELEDTSYKFKVEFNDRLLTPETYLAATLDTLKVSVKEFSEKFGRNELKSLLRSELDQKVLDLLALRYWNKPPSLINNYSKVNNANIILNNTNVNANNSNDDIYWHRKLDLITSSLTKLGVGRMSTTLVTDSLLDEINNIINLTNLKSHPIAKDIVLNSAISVLNARYYSTADQVENCIKPYKFEIDLEDREWDSAKIHTIKLLNEELRQCNENYQELKKSVGTRKLNQVTNYLSNDLQQNSDNSFKNNIIDKDSLAFSATLLQRGREAVFLKDRCNLLKMRLLALKSSQCSKKENKYKCPEIFLSSVVDKITQTSILFLNVELLNDFYYNFPRDLDLKLSVNSLSKDVIEKIAKEDPRIKRHIELQQRKEMLELALSKIENVLAIQKT
ncbi:dynamin-related GTPase MGM1 ASCRUDRAFT_28667, partial [Ascoidea rubescens DSM 1968]